jgi:hypothetical protein
MVDRLMLDVLMIGSLMMGSLMLVGLIDVCLMTDERKAPTPLSEGLVISD